MWVRVNHIERAGDGGDGELALGNLVPDLPGGVGRNLVGHGRQASAGEIELDAIEAVGDDGVERGGECGAGEGFCENAEPHHTPPVTSDSFTLSPVSTERAMAVMARMAAMPSSMPAPCCGAPSRMAAAKFSI